MFFDFLVKEQKNEKINWRYEIKKSKYIFSDPVKFDKKIDPNKLKFGSEISIEDNETGTHREKYFTVKEILMQHRAANKFIYHAKPQSSQSVTFYFSWRSLRLCVRFFLNFC